LKNSLRLLAGRDLLVSHEIVAAVTSNAHETERLETPLTSRELKILRALGPGSTNRGIAK